MKTTNTRLTMTHHDVAEQAGITDAQAWHETDKVLAALTEAGVIKEGEDWVWDQEQDSFFMTKALKWTVLTGLAPLTRYLHTLSYVDTIVEAGEQPVDPVVAPAEPQISTFAEDFSAALEGVAHQAVEVRQQLEEVKRIADLKGKRPAKTVLTG